MNEVCIEDRFLFDLQGFLLLRGVLSQAECAAYLEKLYELEEREYADQWQQAVALSGRRTKETNVSYQTRLNGLPRLDPLFDRLIDHTRVLPYLKEFVGEPQLINTWSISKENGCDQGGWHRGVPTDDYAYNNGRIRSRMFNVVFLLTDNGPQDGCIAALPGAHKSNFDLQWRQYRGLDMPGAVAVTGQAGDVFMFSETVVHNGLPKSTDGVRTNLYYNYVHAHYNVMAREPQNCHHFYFPPELRRRFTPSQRELTQWMDYAHWEY